MNKLSIRRQLISLVDVDRDPVSQFMSIEDFIDYPEEESFAHLVCRMRELSTKSNLRITRVLGRAAKWLGGWPSKDSYYSILRKIASSRGWLKGSAYTFSSFERMASIDTAWALRIPDRESDKAILEAHLSTYPSYYR